MAAAQWEPPIACLAGRALVVYVRKLIENPQVMRYLKKYHEEVLKQFEGIVHSSALDEAPHRRRYPNR